MENEVSKKIRLLLNEVAILNQPDMLEGKIIYHLDTLVKIKSLCAELYLLADQSVNASVLAPVPQKTTPAENPLPPAEVLPPAPEAEQTPINEPVINTENNIPQVEEVLPDPEIVVLPQIAEPKPIDPPTITQVPSPVNLPIVETTPEVVSPPQVASSVNSNSGDALASKISLTRRFEYINNLFAGDASAFMAFLGKIASSANAEQAMAAFDAEAESRNWKRKAESAGDLKQLLRKNI